MAEEELNLTSGPEESERDADGASSSDVVERWLKEIDAADRHERDWRERADKIEALYKDERKKQDPVEGATTRRFNILFANTEVLRAALYQQCPVPDVRRRWLDRDAVGRLSALILNRCIATTIDQGKLDEVMKRAVLDMTLPGRGLAMVKYDPTFSNGEQRVPLEEPGEGAVLPDDVQRDEQGVFRMEPYQELESERVCIEYADWKYVRFSPAKRWDKVRWFALGELMTRDDLVKQFGDKGKRCDLKWMPPGIEDNEENAVFKRALVWVIWNRTQKRVVMVSDGLKSEPLKEVDDPLKLRDFFPCPEPLYSIATNSSMIPTPEYAVYQDHALDLDAIEERISVLQEALRRRGVFDQSYPELEQLAKTGDNKFVAIPNYREFVEKGGLESALQEQDLSGLAKVLTELMQIAESKKAQIYEIIGISDIMRGQVNPQEKLGQSELKSQYGSMRVQTRQRDVQRFARDLIRLVGEVIAEHFSAETLEEMSGIKLARDQVERQQIALGAPDDPRAKRPTWEEVLGVLKSDRLRGFKVDIETDSTLRPQVDQEQKGRIELITSVTGYLQQALPAVAQGWVPKKVATELLLFGVRSFPAGPQLEELLDQWSSGGVDEMISGEGEQGQQQQPQIPPEVQQQLQQLSEQNKQLQVQADDNAIRSKEADVKMAGFQDAQAQRDHDARMAAQASAEKEADRQDKREVDQMQRDEKRAQFEASRQDAATKDQATLEGQLKTMQDALVGAFEDLAKTLADRLEQSQQALVTQVGEEFKSVATQMLAQKRKRTLKVAPDGTKYAIDEPVEEQQQSIQ